MMAGQQKEDQSQEAAEDSFQVEVDVGADDGEGAGASRCAE